MPKNNCDNNLFTLKNQAKAATLLKIIQTILYFSFELICIFTILNNKITIFRFKKVGKKTH
ncbi:MAG: hypothetical protein COB60_01795 [Flavobacteriaceae bacterium]|nr:MAG: hypothetical protein COB60_01795 [Flavobacteriaceae bacterium]